MALGTGGKARFVVKARVGVVRHEVVVEVENDKHVLERAGSAARAKLREAGRAGWTQVDDVAESA